MTPTEDDRLHTSADPASAGHLPVMPDEVLDGLNLSPGMTVVDGTFGGGGHARLIAEHIGPDGTLIGIDRDAEAGDRFTALVDQGLVRGSFFHGSYADMERFAASLDLPAVDGILMDLGLSSLQLADPERGFSFQSDGPLDMRFDRERGMPASSLINTLDPESLADIFFTYGEERNSRRLARAIVAAREEQPIDTTAQLATVVENAAGGRRGARIHPATRVFQALRIAVNGELAELEQGLRAGVRLLRPGGRFTVISFHSIEDRIVKRYFAAEAKGCTCPPELPVCVCGNTPTIRLVNRGVKPSASEVVANPRSRSAILRVVERLP